MVASQLCLDVGNLFFTVELDMVHWGTSFLHFIFPSVLLYYTAEKMHLSINMEGTGRLPPYLTAGRFFIKESEGNMYFENF